MDNVLIRWIDEYHIEIPDRDIVDARTSFDQVLTTVLDYCQFSLNHRTQYHLYISEEVKEKIGQEKAHIGQMIVLHFYFTKVMI
jgi:hypothetical protein